ncbi:MAG: hypothetical protein ACOCZ9_01410 [Spirochaetota bacterium]
MDNQLNVLSRKAGFNSALRHFKIVTEYVGRIGKGSNLADLVNQHLDDGRIARHQIKPLVNALLVDKFGYHAVSHNLGRTIEDPSGIVEVTSKWSKIDLVCVFHHPHTGVFVINPKVEETWSGALPLGKDELLVVYAGPASGEDVKGSVLAEAASDLISLLDGAKVKGKKSFVSDRKAAIQAKPDKAPARKAKAGSTSTANQASGFAGGQTATGGARDQTQAQEAVSTRKRRMTARIPVLVTNELFHNGNVEAWKKVIESYRSKYPSLDVLIWYENERINDINALFKWGKVKHGTPIMISIVGDNPQNVSKLRKYLYEGASPRFEAFLHGGADRTLDLF